MLALMAQIILEYQRHESCASSISASQWNHAYFIIHNPIHRYRQDFKMRRSSGLRLTKKAEPPPTRDVNPVKGRGPTGLYARDSGTASANGGWVNCWVLHSGQSVLFISFHTADLAPESSSPSTLKRLATTSC